HFFEWDQATYNSYFKRIKDAVEITIPKLNEMACEQGELASVPYLSFIANKGPNGENAAYSFVLRGYVRHWLGHVWAEYDRIKLVDIVSPKEQVRMQGGSRARPEADRARPIAKFALSRQLVRELRHRKDISGVMVLVPLLNPK